MQNASKEGPVWAPEQAGPCPLDTALLLRATHTRPPLRRSTGRATPCRPAGERALAAGIEPWQLILDPGLGFAKDGESNLKLMAGLGRVRRALPPPLRRLPMLLGPSRKAFLGRLTGGRAGGRGWGSVRGVRLRGWQLCNPAADVHFSAPALTIAVHAAPLAGRQEPAERDVATAAAAALCVSEGSNIIRAHNVAAVRDAVRVADALCQVRVA